MMGRPDDFHYKHLNILFDCCDPLCLLVFLFFPVAGTNEADKLSSLPFPQATQISHGLNEPSSPKLKLSFKEVRF